MAATKGPDPTTQLTSIALDATRADAGGAMAPSRPEEGGSAVTSGSVTDDHEEDDALLASASASPPEPTAIEPPQGGMPSSLRPMVLVMVSVVLVVIVLLIRGQYDRLLAEQAAIIYRNPNINHINNTKLCPAGHQAADDRTRCEPCPAGWTKTNASYELCRECSAGRYFHGVGSADGCTVCPENHWCGVASTDPVPCASGTKSPVASQRVEECRACLDPTSSPTSAPTSAPTVAPTPTGGPAPSCPSEITRPAPGNGALVLVTGGAGFIGSNLVGLLLSLGYRVRVMDNLSTGNATYVDITLPGLEWFWGDVTVEEDCAQAMRGVTGVFHLAAMSKVAPSLGNPAWVRFCEEQNARGTENILRAALNAKQTVKKVVYAASSTVYGDAPVPQSETTPVSPGSPYAVSKYQGEMLVQMYDDLYQLPTLRLRFFMVYGPRQPSTGAYAIVTGIFARQAAEGKLLTIEGTGEHSRDFIHALDIARGLILGLQSDVHGTVINLGSGRGISVNQVAEMIAPGQARDHKPARLHDLTATLADTRRAITLLRFCTEYRMEDFFKPVVPAPTTPPHRRLMASDISDVSDPPTFKPMDTAFEYPAYPRTLPISAELVLGRGRNEDVEWAKGELFPNIRSVIYDKVNWDAPHFYPYNSGGETTPFLWHILHYWEALPEVLVFTQASPWEHLSRDEMKRRVSAALSFRPAYLPLHGRVITESPSFEYHQQLAAYANATLSDWGIMLPQANTFAPNGVFATTGAAIRARGRNFWLKVYAYHTEWHKYPTQIGEVDHIMERYWHAILDPELLWQKFHFQSSPQTTGWYPV